MSAQNFLNCPKNTGARAPGWPEPTGSPPGHTLCSPSRTTYPKARDSVCVTTSSGSRRKFFKCRKSHLASPGLAAKSLSNLGGVEPSWVGARLESGLGSLRWGRWRRGRRCCKQGPAFLFFFLLNCFTASHYIIRICSRKMKNSHVVFFLKSVFLNVI